MNIGRLRLYSLRNRNKKNETNFRTSETCGALSSIQAYTTGALEGEVRKGKKEYLKDKDQNPSKIWWKPLIYISKKLNKLQVK